MDATERLRKLLFDEEYQKKVIEERLLAEGIKIPHNLGKLEIVPDRKKEIKFWIELLSNPKLDDESNIFNQQMFAE